MSFLLFLQNLGLIVVGVVRLILDFVFYFAFWVSRSAADAAALLCWFKLAHTGSSCCKPVPDAFSCLMVVGFTSLTDQTYSWKSEKQIVNTSDSSRTLLKQWGSEIRTCPVFKWSEVGRS